MTLRKITLVAVALLVSLTAFADSTFTSASSWSAYVPNATTVNFNGIAPSGDYTWSWTPYTVGDLTFSTNGRVYVMSADRGAFWNVDGNSSILVYQTLDVALPSAFDSFAFTYNANSAFNVTLSTGQTFTAQAGMGQFFGITSSTQFTSVSIAADGTQAFGTFSYGMDPPQAPANVPEPASMLLLGSGLLTGLLKRK